MTKKNILLFQGRFSGVEAQTAIKLLESESSTVAAVIKKPKKNVDQEIAGCPTVYIRDNLLRPDYIKPSHAMTPAPFQVLKSALKDPSTVDIVHRKLGPDFFHAKITVLTCLLNIHALFQIHKISVVVSHVVPHSVAGWLCAVYCSHFRIPHYFMRHAVLPGRAVLVRDAVDPKVISKIDDSQPSFEGLDSQVDELLKSRRGRYDDFIPIYEAQRRSTRTSKFRSSIQDLKEVATRASSVKDVMQRRKRCSELEYWSRNKLRSSSYPRVGFFLHYQPERTTFPEAGMLSQQFIMAAMLSQKMEAVGGRVIIKEHPSQLFLSAGAAFRKCGTYEKFACLPSVDIAPLASEAPDVIDFCDVIVSCGGTVILESLARGCPVIYFSRIRFAELHGVTHVSSFEELSAAIDSVIAGRIKVDQQALKGGLQEMYSRTVRLREGDTGSFSEDFFKAVNKIIHH